MQAVYRNFAKGGEFGLWKKTGRKLTIVLCEAQGGGGGATPGHASMA